MQPRISRARHQPCLSRLLWLSCSWSCIMVFLPHDREKKVPHKPTHTSCCWPAFGSDSCVPSLLVAESVLSAIVVVQSDSPRCPSIFPPMTCLAFANPKGPSPVSLLPPCHHPLIHLRSPRLLSGLRVPLTIGSFSSVLTSSQASRR